jgi:hypothetical protein
VSSPPTAAAPSRNFFETSMRICARGSWCRSSTPSTFGTLVSCNQKKIWCHVNNFCELWSHTRTKRNKNHCCKSGSGSTRSAFFWSSWIRIRIQESEVWIRHRMQIRTCGSAGPG